MLAKLLPLKFHNTRRELAITAEQALNAIIPDDRNPHTKTLRNLQMKNMLNQTPYTLPTINSIDMEQQIRSKYEEMELLG